MSGGAFAPLHRTNWRSAWYSLDLRCTGVDPWHPPITPSSTASACMVALSVSDLVITSMDYDRIRLRHGRLGDAFPQRSEGRLGLCWQRFPFPDQAECGVERMHQSGRSRAEICCYRRRYHGHLYRWRGFIRLQPARKRCRASIRSSIRSRICALRLSNEHFAESVFVVAR